jgi:hypothetical protein
MAHVSDYTKASDQVVLDLFNADNSATNASLPLAAVDLGLPVAGNIGDPKNTTMTVTAKAGSGYKGSRIMKYDRVQLSGFFVGKDLVIPKGDAVNLADLIDDINTLGGFNLRAIDYVDTPIPAFEGGIPNETKEVDLVANPDSPAYLGTVTFTVRAEDIDLADVLVVTEMDGLTLPVA